MNTVKIIPSLVLLLASTTLYAKTGSDVIINSKGLEVTDLEIIKSYSRDRLNDMPEGTVLTWTNPKTKNSGEVVLARLFNNDRSECRTIEHFIDINNSKDDFEYSSTICKDGQGAWVNLP